MQMNIYYYAKTRLKYFQHALRIVKRFFFFFWLDLIESRNDKFWFVLRNN